MAKIVGDRTIRSLLAALFVFTIGTPSLATDMASPLFAKMAKGADGVYAWRFYNELWEDVTDTCGLSAPDAATMVYVTDTAEIAPILANPGTPAGYRIESLAVNADGDLTALSPLTIALANGFVVDLNGHALTLPGSFIHDRSAPPVDLVTNGDFEAKSLSDGAWDESEISDWSKSGTVALIKNNNAYAYKQSSTGSGENQNTTVMCYIAIDGYITQTITVSEQVLCTLSLNKANKNYYNGGKKYNTSYGNVLIDDSPKTELTSNAGNQNTFSATFELSAGSHTLKIACTGGRGGMSVDNVKIVCTPSTGRITSSADGGELHVNVPPDVVVTNSAVSIDGHVKFVKEGAGTFVSKRTELFYDGGNEIVEGKLTTAEGSGSNRDWSPAYRVLGQTNTTITVRKNGTLDIAGNYEYGNYNIVLDGGHLRSSRLIDTGPINQTTNEWDGIGQLSLTTNSTFDLWSDTLFSGWDDVPIKLNGHELCVNMPADSKSLYMAKDMTNGTIRLTPANVGKRRFVICKRAVDSRTVDLIDEAGCVSPATNFSVRCYTSTAPAGNDWWNGTHRMYVYGTFTPQTDYFYGCTMMDGSMIDLSGRSGTWATTGSANCGRRTVDFADNATIYVKLDVHRMSPRKVISWTTPPSNLNGLTFKRAKGCTRMIKKDDGVYIQPSFIVIAL